MGKAEYTMIILLFVMLIAFYLQSSHLSEFTELEFYNQQSYLLRIKQIDQ